MLDTRSRPELLLLDAAGGTLPGKRLGRVAYALLAAGELADTEIIPANGRPARAPGLARDLAIAVNDGLVRLHKDRFVLTSAGRQQLARSGSQASARARRVAAKA